MTVRRVRRPAAAPAAEEGTVTERRRALRLARATAEKLPADTMVVRLLNNEDPFTSAIEKAPAKMQDIRPGDYLHVSDLLGKCVRKRCVTAFMGVSPPAKRLSLSDLLTFAQGDAIHDTLKDRARQGAPSQVWGKWSCKCEALYHEDPCTYGEIDQTETCPHCGTVVDQYHEVSMIDEENWIVGNPDMLQYLPHVQAFHITELKSIAAAQFEDLARPKPEHVLQVLFYWWLMNKLGYRLTSSCTIFYASKGWKFGADKPYKSFVIDVQMQINRLEPMIEDARAHKAAILAIRAGETPVMPSRSLCPSKAAPTAKSCEVRDVCFEV